MNHQITCYNRTNKPTKTIEKELLQFLHTHLEQYGDSKAEIQACFDYTFNNENTPGGFALVLSDEDTATIKGVVVVNYTGMSGYVPANLLVYIAVDAQFRGQGIGQTLIKEVFSKTEGGIALHCEPKNPARKLYEKLGFESKYLEMRHA